jgi:uncharacterized protein involved in exopolysaccharide biosynthesis
VSAANDRIQLIEQRVMTRDNVLRVAEKFDLFPELRSRGDIVVTNVMRASVQIEPAAIGPPAFRPENRTIAFSVGFEHEQPKVAAAVANEFVTLILNEDMRARTTRASNTTRFVEREVDALEQQLAAINAEISRFSQENKDALPEVLEFQLTQLEAKGDDLSELDEALRTLDDEKRLLDLELRLKASTGEEGPGAGQSTTARLQSLKAELVEKSSVYSEIHPEIRSLRTQIDQLERQLDAAASGIAASARLDLSKLPPNLRLIAERIDTLARRRDSFVKRREALVQSIAELRAIVARAPDVESALGALQRQKEGIQRNLDQMAERLATAKLGERLQEGDQAERLQLLEAAQIPQWPIAPDRSKLLLIVMGLAGAAGLGSVYAADALDPTIRGSVDLRSVVEGRMVVRLPYVTTWFERRRRRARLAWGVVSIAGLAVACFVAAHLFVTRLDSLLPEMLERVGLLS